MSSTKNNIESIEKQIAAAFEKKGKQIALLNADLEQKIAALNQQHANKLSSLSSSSDQEIGELTKKLNVQKEIEEHEKKIVALKASIATPKAETKSAPSYWRVSDGHSGPTNRRGAAALESTESSSYGVFITATIPAGDSSKCEIELSDGTKAIVSRDRWNRAKNVSVGDVVFLPDKFRKQVFKGTVLARTGPFRSDLSKNSFGQRAHLRRIAQKIDVSGENILKGIEIELNWSVKWELVGRLTQEWQNYLHSSENNTVRALSGPPPF